MADIRTSRVVDPKQPRECDLIQLYDYDMEEVLLPADAKRTARKAIHVRIRGENLRAVAQPLIAFVGKEPLRFLRIAPDERSVDGVLLAEPAQGAHVEVHLGDQDAARHPQPVDLSRIKRMR